MDHIEIIKVMVLKGTITAEQADRAINLSEEERITFIESLDIPEYTDEQIAEFEEIAEELNDLFE